MRKTAISVACALLLTLGIGGPALAADEDPGTYAPPPRSDTMSSLSGSSVEALCSANAPVISYSVVLTAPDAATAGRAARLVLSNGSQRVVIPLGDLVDNRLSGSTLWPGASVGSDGRGNGWPGWMFTDGKWAETSGNYAWTRGDISAALEVGTSLAVPLSYPSANDECLTGPSMVAGAYIEDPASADLARVSAASLPATGGDTEALMPVLWGAGALVLAGGVLVLARRTRRARD